MLFRSVTKAPATSSMAPVTTAPVIIETGINVTTTNVTVINPTIPGAMKMDTSNKGMPMGMMDTSDVGGIFMGMSDYRRGLRSDNLPHAFPPRSVRGIFLSATLL